MTDVVLPIANGFYQSDSLPISAQECVNWYPNIVQGVGLNQETLFGTPGKYEATTTGTLKQANRGSHVMNGILYVVNGIGLWRVNRVAVVDMPDTFTTTHLGDVGGTGRVSMADNGTQLMTLIPGGSGWIFTEDPDTFTQITDLDFTANGNPQQVRFIDGYFALTTDSKKFIVSSLNDGLAYNALDFGTAEADPDEITGLEVFKNQLFIGGSETMETFQNIGGTGFPFQRTGLFLSKGISAPFSIIKTSDAFMWIGAGENEGPAIWAFQSNDVVKVSTTAIDNILQSITDTEMAQVFSWSYAEKGAYFVGFRLPTTTLVIDTITGRWHERKSQITDVQNVTTTQPDRMNSVAAAYGQIFVGDSVDGRIGVLDIDTYTEYGKNIIRPVVGQPFQNNMNSFTVPSMELTMEAGVGNNEVPNPKIMMDFSRDGGKTFVDQRIREIGKKGEYTRRTIWRRNGRMSRFMCVRFTLSDAVKPVIIQLTGNIKGGTR